MKISFNVLDIAIDKNIWIKFNILIDDIEAFNNLFREHGIIFAPNNMDFKIKSMEMPEIGADGKTLYIHGHGREKDNKILTCGPRFFTLAAKAIHEFNSSLQES